MINIAIMKKSWGLLPKILTKEKKIESRWYKARYSPWNRIKPLEIVYFKDSEEPVTVRMDCYFGISQNIKQGNFNFRCCFKKGEFSF